MAIVTLVAALGVSFPEQPRSSAVQKVASLAWFFVLLVLGIVLAVLGASVHTYVIACGIGLVAWILTAYFIVKSDQ